MTQNAPTFTATWFEESARPTWEQCLGQIVPQPRRVLEIGSFEGQATCYLLQWAKEKEPLEVHCIDTWEGSPELTRYNVNMEGVEARFRANVAACLGQSRVETHKGPSREVLPHLLLKHAGYFDFIYVDGSHSAPDVLSDAVMSFLLLRPKGILAFDDYLWCLDHSPLATPKIAIDAFTNVFRAQARIVVLHSNQVWVQKL